MIPFNHLGVVFNTFGALIYPKYIRVALCKFLKSLSSHAKVLDIGAGLLCHFGYACREDMFFIAVDLAEDMMKYAKTYVETFKGSAESLPFEDESFDALMMGESYIILKM